VPPQTAPSPSAGAGAANAGASAPPHPTITLTFPIIFLSNPQRQSSSDNNNSTSDDGAQNVYVREEFQNLFTRFLQAMPSMPFTPGQFEPAPNGPPKKHATQSALDSLKPVEVATLPEGERRCHICMQDFYVKPLGPRSPYVEDVKEEGDQDVFSSHQNTLTWNQNESVEETVSKDEGEVPLQMPCGHVFGSACLKEWLYQSPTCPLCREEVESYIDEPQPTSLPALGTFDGPIPWFQVPNPPPQPSSTVTEQSDDMQVDPPSTDASNPTQPQFHAQIPRLAFQFIFTTPASSPPANPTSSSNTSQTPPQRTPTPSPSPNISRPSSAHTVRHHPYARTTTPTPLSGPSITDRPDLFCAQRASGLCTHDIADERLIRLECGHAFHPDCLQESMVVGEYPLEQNERRCPRCRRWVNVLQ
jgi:Ring finger domain